MLYWNTFFSPNALFFRQWRELPDWEIMHLSLYLPLDKKSQNRTYAK